MSLLNRITLIVLGGAIVGALLTGVVLYFVMVIAGVDPETARKSTIPYTVLILYSFWIPVIMIRVMINQFIFKKVRALRDVIDRISKGDIDAKVNIDSDDELGRMAEAFERMRRSLKLLMTKVGGS